MDVSSIIVSMLDHRGADFLDEHGLITHALALDHAFRVFPERTEPDLQRLLYEVMYGAKLPRVRFAIGQGKFDQYQPLLAEFRAMLERMMESPKAASAFFKKDWLSALSKISFVPVEIRADGQLGFRLRTNELRGALAYVLALLFDKKKVGADLGRCQLPECKSFFLAPQSKVGGRPRRRYCSEAHMLEVHNRDAARRVRKSRRAKRGK